MDLVVLNGRTKAPGGLRLFNRGEQRLSGKGQVNDRKDSAGSIRSRRVNRVVLMQVSASRSQSMQSFFVASIPSLQSVVDWIAASLKQLATSVGARLGTTSV